MPQPTSRAVAGAHAWWDRPGHRRWVPLPLTLLVVAAGVDLVAAAASWPAGIAIAYYLTLAGLVAAAPAALLGVLDAARVRRVAGAWPARLGRHVATVLTALACFGLAAFLRAHPEIPPDPPILALVAVGALLLLLAARFGSRVRRHMNAGHLMRITIGDGDPTSARGASPQ